MTDKNNKKTYEIGEDKVIDLLLHAATREDIAELRNVDIARLDNKIDSVRADLKQDIVRLDQKIDRVEDTLRGDIHKLDNRIDKLDNRIDKLDNRIGALTKWVVGGMITLMGGMVAGFSVLPTLGKMQTPIESQILLHQIELET